ncbi:MAG: BON domain-containing protein [Cyanobacteria bacterium P01_F01_bin.56]
MSIYQQKKFVNAGALGCPSSLALEWASDVPTWFQATPPERIGLYGEYDYHGLQKRVEALYSRHFSHPELAQVTVSQRGRVVILQGIVRDLAMLEQLVELAKQVEGTFRVETNWVTCEADNNVLWAV